MARGLWAQLAKLPPVDFVALAAERGRHRKHTLAEVEKMKAAIKAARVAKRKAVSAQILQRVRRKRKPKHFRERIVATMEPGHWYSRMDVARLIGARKDDVKMPLRDLVARGLVKRELDPDYAPWWRHIQPRTCEISWLYSLTTGGEAKRIQWAYMA